MRLEEARALLKKNRFLSHFRVPRGNWRGDSMQQIPHECALLDQFTTKQMLAEFGFLVSVNKLDRKYLRKQAVTINQQPIRRQDLAASFTASVNQTNPSFAFAEQ